MPLQGLKPAFLEAKRCNAFRPVLPEPVLPVPEKHHSRLSVEQGGGGAVARRGYMFTKMQPFCRLGGCVLEHWGIGDD